MSHLTQSMVEQFFELEKESARGVLRKEMDSAMDTIFKQMKRKLMQLVDNVELGNGILDEQDDLDVRQQHELYSNLMTNGTNHIPSATTNSHPHLSVLNASNLSEGGLDDQIHHEPQLYSNLNQIPSTSTDSHVPDNTSNQYNDDEIVVKNELGEIVNIIPNELIPSSSSNQSQPSNEQSNDNIDDLFDELDDDDEEDCDCPDCVGDLFAMKEEGVVQEEEEDDDDVQLIENPDESNDSNSRPSKRARVENAQKNDQSNPERVITISLNCHQCSQTFNNQTQLNAHLKSVHSIELYQCFHKDCNRSFDTTSNLIHHLSITHPNTIKWPCGECTGQFKSHIILTTHHKRAHQSGAFRCSQPDCQFVGEQWQTVRNHFESSHKQFACQHVSCTNRYPNASQLKRHQLTHLDVKPYRCKWSNCQFDTAYKGDVLRHIRQHLNKVGKVKRAANISLDPNDYFEVLQDL